MTAQRKIRTDAVVLVLAVIALIDLAIVAHPIIHPEAGWKAEGYRIIRSLRERENYKRPDDMINFLKTDTSYFRIFPAPAAPLGRWSHSTPPFSDNRYMVFRIFSLGGYHAAKLESYQDIMDTMFASFNGGVIPFNILNMLNAKYILATAPLFEENVLFPLVWRRGNAYVYENTKVLPRAFLVDRFRIMEPGRILKTLLAADFDPAREVLLEEEPLVVPESSEGSSVEITEYGLNRIVLQARIARPCMLVLSEIAYRDWQALVDGTHVPLLTANYCLRALPLTPDNHEIQCVFKSNILINSLIVSIVVFCVVATVPVIHAVAVARKDR
jgi:hypothetical protein